MNDIPDSVPDKLSATGRAPSYKAIAIAILRNDHCLHSLGYGYKDTAETIELYAATKHRQSRQMDMFRGDKQNSEVICDPSNKEQEWNNLLRDRG